MNSKKILKSLGVLMFGLLLGLGLIVVPNVSHATFTDCDLHESETDPEPNTHENDAAGTGPSAGMLWYAQVFDTSETRVCTSMGFGGPYYFGCEGLSPSTQHYRIEVMYGIHRDVCIDQAGDQ